MEISCSEGNQNYKLDKTDRNQRENQIYAYMESREIWAVLRNEQNGEEL